MSSELLLHNLNYFVAGFSVLHLAIVKHRNECAKLVISELGSKAVNALNESGVTAVHIAASAGTLSLFIYQLTLNCIFR